MTTEVKHGPEPTFEHQIEPGSKYGLTLAGFYTTTPGWTAGGVTAREYASGRNEKRMNELLGARTIFLNWWLNEWVEYGEDLRAGAAQVVHALNAELSHRQR